ncbi:MAG TPA: polymer-forming cytoskeletal protein [Bryobacteraceae bacterium]|nr:polymer-forming cytoskeletal protein [Bryobacteraceae bacterium]
MWNKDQSASSPTPQAPSAPATRAATTGDSGSVGDGALIGETMRIKGEVFSKDELRLEGEVEGKLESQNRLTIGPKGKADASIKATEVIIAGTVKGNVEANQRIVLRKGANLVGDVKTAGIVIEDGAYFRGGIDIARPEGTTQAAQAAGR